MRSDVQAAVELLSANGFTVHPPAVEAVSDAQLREALHGVMSGLLARAQQEREASQPYQDLFASFKDGGVMAAVRATEDTMRRQAMDLMQLLQQSAGVRIDNTLFDVLLALPLARHVVRTDIEEKDGSSCSKEKSTLILRRYLYNRLGVDVEVTPWVPPAK